MVAVNTPARNASYRLGADESAGIDIFRAVLAQWVIVSHLCPEIFGVSGIPGTLAVWCFFAISGYVNYMSAAWRLDAYGFMRGSVRYYIARVARLGPLLLLSYFTVSLVLGTFANADFYTLIPAVLFLKPNMPNNGPLWSIVLEFQFYALTPALLFACLRLRGAWQFAAAGAALCMASVVIGYGLIAGGWTQSLDDRTFLSHLPMYIFGMWLARNRKGMAALPLAAAQIAGALAVVSIIVVTVNYNDLVPSIGYLFREGRAVPFLAAGAVLGGGFALHRIQRRPRAITVYWGRLTYEVYLFHGLFTFLHRHYALSSDAFTVTAFQWALPMLAAATYGTLLSGRARHVSGLSRS